MAKKDDTIIINNFQTGVSENNLAGIQSIVECDIDSNPGVIQSNNLLEQKSTNGVFTDMVVAITSDGEYALDDDGRISESPFTSLMGGTPNALDEGLEVWKGYLFHVGISEVNVRKISTGTWTEVWDGDTLELGGQYRFIFIASNGDLYIGTNNYIYNLHEVAGKTFDPTDNTTFTVDTKALTLPDGYDIVSISEIANNLTISANKESKGAVFLWDKYSETFYDPIKINEKISQSIAYNGLVYINTSPQCTFYVTNGSSIQRLASLPQSSLTHNDSLGRSSTKDSYISAKPNAIEIVNRKILFSPIFGSSDISTSGIWSFDPSKNTFKVENILSTRVNKNVTIGAIRRPDSTTKPFYYIAGYEDTTDTTDVFAIDEVDENKFYTDNEMGFISQLYRVGTTYAPKTFQRMELIFASPATDSSVKVSVQYRRHLYDTWKNIIDEEIMLDVDDSGKDSLIKDFGATAHNIQFKFSFNRVDKNFQLAEVRVI